MIILTIWCEWMHTCLPYQLTVVILFFFNFVLSYYLNNMYLLYATQIKTVGYMYRVVDFYMSGKGFSYSLGCCHFIFVVKENHIAAYQKKKILQNRQQWTLFFNVFNSIFTINLSEGIIYIVSKRCFIEYNGFTEDKVYIFEYKHLP